MSSRRQRGLSLLEVLVASSVLVIGFAASFKCLSGFSDAHHRTLEEERMQRLAVQVYDQIQIENTLKTGTQDGDFRDRGEPRYIWHAEKEPVGTGNLNVLRVEVDRRDDNFVHAQKIQGLVCGSASGGSS